MNILIIGGSGHVSGAVARAALAAGHSVWAVTRGMRPLPPGMIGLTADRRDPQSLATAITGAAMTWDLVADCICYDPAEMRHAIALFRQRCRQYVFISTDFVYDPARRQFPQPADRAHYVTDGPGSLGYGWKKRLCEEALSTGDTGDMAWTVLRPCHIYGPTSLLGCLPLHSRDPGLLARIRAGEPVQLVGGGHFLQQPILADDLALTVLSVAGNDGVRGRVFNAAGPDTIESRRYYERIGEVLGTKVTTGEVPVQPFLAANPDKSPFICHRLNDIAPLRACGLHVPATPVDVGLRLHVEGLPAAESRP